MIINLKAPFTGRNFHFRQAIVGNKPYCLVLNKADLADLTQKKKIVSKLDKDGYSPVFFTTLKNTEDKTAKKVITKIFLPYLLDFAKNDLYLLLFYVYNI